MKLYLNEKLESIYVLNQLNELLTAITSDPTYSKISDISNVTQLFDPADDFLTYYISDSGLGIDKSRKQYIANSLYAAKGAPNVIDILASTLEIQITYEYNYPVLTVVQFNSLRVTNLALFVKKFNELMYNLIYYTQITTYIKNYLLNLVGNLIDNYSISAIGFTNVTMTKYDYNF